MESHIEEFVRNPYMAVLSTVGAGGNPQATTIWYAFEDGVFWFYVSRDSLKARNMRSHPNVALTIDEREWPYKQAVIYGAAVEQPLDADRARRIAVHYLGEEAGGAMDDEMTADLDRVGFQLEPRRVYWQDFSGE
jgi:PPOX class probable F420-dependent enzyme